MKAKRMVLALVAVQAADAAYNIVPSDRVKADLEHLQLPDEFRYLFGTIKLASAAGLLIGLKRPGLGRLSARLLVLYFVCALAAHVRIKDEPIRCAPAAGMLAWAAAASTKFA